MWRYLLLLVLTLLTTSLPLTTTFGANLEYEYALLAGYWALFALPLAAVAMPAAWIPRDERGVYTPVYAFEMFWTFLISPALAVAPGVALFYWHDCPCSAPGFAFWMTILWYPTWILANGLYHLVLCGRTHGWSRGWVAGALVAVAVATMANSGGQLWFNPQKRLVSLWFGFLHGPIYDDWIAVDAGVLWARGCHLALATLLLILAFARRRVVFGLATAAVLGAWLGLSHYADDSPSLANSKAALDQLMSGTLAGEGFTVHYQDLVPPGGKPNQPAPMPVLRLARDAAFHVQELTKILGGDGSPLPHVEIYLYPNEDTKKLWFGGASTDVTDVHTPSIHIALGAWPHPTLRHELVHALASGFGYHGLGFHPNMAFTEGLAVALAPTAGPLTLNDGAAALLKSGQIEHVEDLFSPAFWRFSGNRSYTASGSFIKELIEVHGIAGVKALYSGKSWQDAFGQDREALIKEWQARIFTGFDADRVKLAAESLYRYPGILNDLCPHSKADLERRDTTLFTRTRQPVGWDPETDQLPWLVRLDPEDRSARLALWRRELRRLALDHFPPLARLETWRAALSRARHVPAVALEDVEMGLVESDLARLTGDQAGSVKILEDLASSEAKHNLGDGTRRELFARLRAEQIGGAQAGEWRRFLAGWRVNLPAVDPLTGPFLEAYLRLRNDQSLTLSTGELGRLLDEKPMDAALPKSFALEWYRLLANRLMLLGDYQTAARAYVKASEKASAATREVFEEHARRAAFYKAKGPLLAPTAQEHASR